VVLQIEGTYKVNFFQPSRNSLPPDRSAARELEAFSGPSLPCDTAPSWFSLVLPGDALPKDFPASTTGRANGPIRQGSRFNSRVPIFPARRFPKESGSRLVRDSPTRAASWFPPFPGFLFFSTEGIPFVFSQRFRKELLLPIRFGKPCFLGLTPSSTALPLDRRLLELSDRIQEPSIQPLFLGFLPLTIPRRNPPRRTSFLSLAYRSSQTIFLNVIDAPPLMFWNIASRLTRKLLRPKTSPSRTVNRTEGTGTTFGPSPSSSSISSSRPSLAKGRSRHTQRHEPPRIADSPIPPSRGGPADFLLLFVLLERSCALRSLPSLAVRVRVAVSLPHTPPVNRLRQLFL